MRALEGLPSSTKNLIIPVIRVCPWLTARQLMRSIERTKEAIGDRFFALDLDSTRRNHRNSEAYNDFEQLFDPHNGWQNYYEFVAGIDFAVPVLRSGGDMQLPTQIAHVQNLDRGLFVRVDVQHPFSVEAVARACAEEQVENVVFVLDCGWRETGLLPYEAACVGLIRTITEVAEDFEFVVAGGDFPASGFDTKGDNFQIPGEERQLVEAVRRVLNDVEIVFGDWASTRERPTDDVIRRSRPRLDMPTRAGWECWRSPPAGTFAQLAARAARDRRLGTMSDLWGEQLIIATKDGGEPAIKSPTTAAAVRINLHMVMQAHFDTGTPQVGDELVVGEL